MIWQKLMVADAAPAGYSCTITIGDYFSFYYGYEGDTLAFGSISNQPISGEVMRGCFWEDGENLSVAFVGDITGLVGSLNVWLGGVNYGGAGNWSFGSGETTVTRTGAPSNKSGTILLEIK
jgi:hypothetical protein